MSISNDLFTAILAMDSYNRGGDAGLGVAGSQIGNASLLTLDLPAGSQTASFFAQAYTLANGQKVISYRGTDSALDVQTGWPTGIGVFDNSQATLAAQFFQQVVGNGKRRDRTPKAWTYSKDVDTRHKAGHDGIQQPLTT